MSDAAPASPTVTRIGAWSMRAGLFEPKPWAKVAASLGLTYEAAAQHVTEIRYWSLQELSGGMDAAFVRARCAGLRR